MVTRLHAWLRSIDGRSFLLGVLVAWLPLALAAPVGAWDLNLRSIGSLTNLGKKVIGVVDSLAGIKTGLDSDVQNLTGDAKQLFGDASNLLEIKNKLTELADKTQAQITEINSLVGTVESHLKKTQDDITSTAKNVARIDEVRKTLQSGN